MTPPPDSELRQALAGLRGVLLDLDGVLMLKERAIAGAAEAIERLQAARFPFLVITNATLTSRATLSADLQRAGVPLPADRIMSACSASVAYVRRRYDGAPVYVLAAPDALTEFEGLCLLSNDEAAAEGARAAAVIVGDAGDEFTPQNLRSAFRLVRGGARLIAMHKNRWWLTPDGPVLDAGGFVAGLEYATERRALVLGKPSRTMFGEAVRALAEEHLSGEVPLHPGEVAMVGDDVWNDVLGAQRAGLRGVFVRSGKHGEPHLAKAASAGKRPTAVASSVAAVVAALGL